MNKKNGSISVAAIIILSVIILVSNNIHSRFISSSRASKAYMESENLIRKAEGAAIIAKDKVLEATRILYEGCNNKEELKAKIESPYKSEYVGYIEKKEDIGIDGIIIDVLDNYIEQNGTDLYRFRIKCTAYKDGMEKYVTINVSLKNIMDSMESTDKNQIPNNDGKGISGSTENGEKIYNINDAVDFRIIRYN